MSIRLPRKTSPSSGVQVEARVGPPPTPAKLLTIKEAAAFAVVSVITIRRWLKAGFLRPYRAGHQIRIDKADLVRFLSQ